MGGRKPCTSLVSQSLQHLSATACRQSRRIHEHISIRLRQSRLSYCATPTRPVSEHTLCVRSRDSSFFFQNRIGNPDRSAWGGHRPRRTKQEGWSQSHLHYEKEKGLIESFTLSAIAAPTYIRGGLSLFYIFSVLAPCPSSSKGTCVDKSSSVPLQA